MKKILIASILSLGVGAFVTGPVSARDTTPPVITANMSGTLGANGWYTSNVSLSWTVTESRIQAIEKSGCGSVSVTTDTSGVTYTCTATSAGGTSTKSVTIKRDATNPTATITTPASGATYALNQAITASYACNDARSGMATCTGTVANGAAISTSPSGTKTFTVTATDQAGNTTTTSVSYTVAGSTSTTAKGTQLFAWNDLGMHCADSDFSVFTLLPPFNNLNAQLVVGGKLVDPSSGYTPDL